MQRVPAKKAGIALRLVKKHSKVGVSLAMVSSSMSCSIATAARYMAELERLGSARKVSVLSSGRDLDLWLPAG